MTGLESRTVDWWPVHQFVLPLLDEVGELADGLLLPWQRLGTTDPVKLAAIFDAARHHALRVNTAQTAMAEASHAIAGAADWASIAREAQQRKGIYIPREVA